MPNIHETPSIDGASVPPPSTAGQPARNATPSTGHDLSPSTTTTRSPPPTRIRIFADLTMIEHPDTGRSVPASTIYVESAGSGRYRGFSDPSEVAETFRDFNRFVKDRARTYLYMYEAMWACDANRTTMTKTFQAFSEGLLKEWCTAANIRDEEITVVFSPDKPPHLEPERASPGGEGV